MSYRKALLIIVKARIKKAVIETFNKMIPVFLWIGLCYSALEDITFTGYGCDYKEKRCKLDNIFTIRVIIAVICTFTVHIYVSPPNKYLQGIIYHKSSLEKIVTTSILLLFSFAPFLIRTIISGSIYCIVHSIEKAKTTKKKIKVTIKNIKEEAKELAESPKDKEVLVRPVSPQLVIPVKENIEIATTRRN